jgi:biopolymer transport protein ExbD
MPARQSIRHRRARRKLVRDFELPLTSMMDMLVIILVFLLKSYSASTNSFSSVQGLKLPISKSQEIPPDSLQVVVTPEGLNFEDQRIVQFIMKADAVGSSEGTYELRAEDLDEEGLRIRSLFDALTRSREKAELLRAKAKARDESGQPLPFDGVLAIQADQRVRYETIRRIMYTAAAAGYKTFRFLAMSREG